MAFNFIPKSSEEISKVGLKNGGSLIALFEFLIKIAPSIKDPIAIDKARPDSVKVLRDFIGRVDLPFIKKTFGLSATWGSGSRGNRGAGNRGNLFEYELTNDLNEYLNNGLQGSFKYPVLIKELVRYYSLDDVKKITVVPEGALNKSRPLVFLGDQPVIKDKNFNIGATVTDITLKSDTRNIYLSCKLGGTVSFFNVGIKSILKKDEIKTGDISNVNGKLLLNTLGIDPVLFCRVFNEYNKQGIIPDVREVDVTNQINSTKLSTLLKSGIGYGYHLVHKLGNSIHHHEMTSAELDKSTKIESVKIIYPIGKYKRVDAMIETPGYSFKLNIRDTSGSSEPFPSHMLMDYKFK